MLRARARARESYPARPQKSSRIVASAEPRRRSPGRAFLMVEIHFTTTSLFFVDVVIACYSVSWLVRFVWCGVLCHRYRHEETAAKNQTFAAETPWVCLFFVAANVRTQSAYFFIRCTLKIFPKKNRRPKWYFSNTICSSHFVEIFSNLPRKLARLRFMRWDRECVETAVKGKACELLLLRWSASSMHILCYRSAQQTGKQPRAFKKWEALYAAITGGQSEWYHHQLPDDFLVAKATFYLQ